MPKSAFVYNAVIFRHRLYIILYVPIATRAGNLSSSPTQAQQFAFVRCYTLLPTHSFRTSRNHH